MRSKKRKKKIKIIPNNTLLNTVDIGKEINSACFFLPDNREEKRIKFSNDKTGFNKFLMETTIVMNKYKLEEVYIGYESTGSYAEPFIHYMSTKPKIRLIQINPKHTKKAKEIVNNSPNKTDDKDPEVIQTIIRLGHWLNVVIPKGAAADLRALAGAREAHIKNQMDLSNQLHSLVFEIFPEFVNILGTSSKTALKLLKEAPTPEEIVNLGIDELTRKIKKYSRSRLGALIARRFYKAAQQSVGVKEGQESKLIYMSHILVQLDQLDSFIKGIESQMEKLLEEIPSSKHLLSIKGIGTVSVAVIIGEVGDFRNFKRQREIIKMAGLDLYEISSGKHKGERHISKRGRSLLRKILYYAALRTVKKDGIMHDVYQKLIGNGMVKNKAVIAIAKKLLVLMFAIVRDDRSYIKDYHNLNYIKLKKAA